MKFSNNEMQDDGNEEGWMNEDVGPPPEGTSMTEEAKNTDESCEEGYVNDDMGSLEKVCCNMK